MLNPLKLIPTWMGLLVLAGAVGCISSPDGRLPEVPKGQVAGLRVPGGAAVEASFKISQQPVAIAHEELRLAVQEALGGPPQPGGAWTRVVVKVENDQHVGLMILGILFQELSVTIIPWRYSDDFKMFADITTPDGRRYNYVLEDSMGTWVQFFLVFFLSSDSMPGKVREEILQNMTHNLLLRLERDGVATRGPAPPPAALPPGTTPPTTTPGVQPQPAPSPPPAQGLCGYCGQTVPPGAQKCPGCGVPR